MQTSRRPLKPQHWITLITCILGLGACASLDAPEQFNGYWASEGYGRVIAVAGNSLEAYDQAATICVKSAETTAELLEIIGSSTFDFAQDSSYVDITLANEPFKRRYKRLDQLPSSCSNPTASNPINNFDAFNHYFAEHYAFFDIFDVDWQQHTSAARVSINAQTTDAELFAIFSQLLEPLQDAHINLFAQIDGKDLDYGPEQSPLAIALAARAQQEGVSIGELQQRLLGALWQDNISKQILGGKGTTAANGYIKFGVVQKASGDNLGYLAVQREGGYAPSGQSLAALNAVMDNAIRQWQQEQVTGVIIDIAVNFGGSDYLGRAIASRFAAKRTLAYRKRAADRADAEDFDLYVEPYSGLTYTGPVTLVTSASTVSAGEILTMSLRSLPNVTHIGEPTRGSLSDILAKTLPNGWVVTLSNEIYTDHQGKLWEGPGILPTRSIPVLAPQAPVSSHLQAIKTAIQLTPAPQ